MTPTQNLIATQARKLIPQVTGLYERALKHEREHTEGLQRVAEGYQDSARNLLHYLAIRQVDVRPIQMALAAIGLSSLGRMEAHTLSTLNAVLFALHRIADQDWKPAIRPPVNFDTGRMLLERHAQALLGSPAGRRSAPIMVTMPTEAAANPALAHDLLAAGSAACRARLSHCVW
jgi:pyruvate kinase